MKIGINKNLNILEELPKAEEEMINFTLLLQYKLLTKLLAYNTLLTKEIPVGKVIEATTGEVETLNLSEYLFNYKVVSLGLGDCSFKTSLVLEYARLNNSNMLLIMEQTERDVNRVLSRINSSFNLDKPSNLDIMSYSTAYDVVYNGGEVKEYSTIFLESPTTHSNLDILLENLINAYAFSRSQQFVILGY